MSPIVCVIFIFCNYFFAQEEGLFSVGNLIPTEPLKDVLALDKRGTGVISLLNHLTNNSLSPESHMRDCVRKLPKVTSRISSGQILLTVD